MPRGAWLCWNHTAPWAWWSAVRHPWYHTVIPGKKTLLQTFDISTIHYSIIASCDDSNLSSCHPLLLLPFLLFLPLLPFLPFLPLLPFLPFPSFPCLPPLFLPFPPLPPCPSSLPKLRPPPSSSFPSPSPCPFLPPTFMLIPYSSSCTLGTLLLLLAGCTLHPGIWKVWSDDYIRADGPHLHYKTIQTQKQHGGYLESLPKTIQKYLCPTWLI